ncbi:MAG TPA: 2-dehydropantoate 2-reductase [Acidimicrobiales bacterium]|jgi:2-dehydropantoate 2-reductase|nr:2-dehydropantoate 2-reductase [Acidimicrobiales bacterium]
MRFVVFGAGAVGGVVGGRLAEHGHDVVLIARGAHLEAIRRHGLALRSPAASVTVRPPAMADPADAQLGPGDVVLLAVKSQDTELALTALAAACPVATPVACLQNGVANERAALRRFANVYAVPVMLPSLHLEPGVVGASSTPTTGILDVGRYPSGVDDTAETIAAAFARSTFSAEVRPDVMRLKYSKLLMNLANAVQALFGERDGTEELVARARREGRACLEVAGIDVASREEELDRRGDLITIGPIDGMPRGGGSTWQSLARGAGSVEVDHLNGEIVLLGRLHGVPTPVNAALQRWANEAARVRRPPAMADLDAFLAEVD